VEITDTAWLSGLFEGEGCISFEGKNSVSITIGMTDRDVIQRCHRLTGAGHLSQYTADRRNTLFVWKIGLKSDVVWLLEAMLPYFGERRAARALAALERLKGCADRGVCKRGHPIEGANVYAWVEPSTGLTKRRCRSCRDLYEAGRPPRRALTDAPR